jgi:hypothetical protein
VHDDREDQHGDEKHNPQELLRVDLVWGWLHGGLT